MISTSVGSRFGLEQLFGRQGRSEFLARSWSRRPYVHHGPLSRFTALAEIPELADTEELLRSLEHPVDVLGPNGRRVTHPRAIEAWEEYRAGEVMVYVTDLQVLPGVEEMCASLAEELHVPSRFVTCEGFAAGAGVPVTPHFDHESNFMIQMRGDKTWRLAENTALANPLFAYFADNPNRHYDDGAHPYTGEPLPRGMPDEVTEFVAGPGTATFLPRGFWHETLTHDESFSIGFVINPPTIADVVVSCLQRHLHRRAAWRAHPLHLGREGGRTVLAAEIEAALAEVETFAGRLRGVEVVDAYLEENTETPRPLYGIGRSSTWPPR